MGLIILLLLATLLTPLTNASESLPRAFSNDTYPRLYDVSFKKWSRTYNRDIPWYWLKAQCYQESLLKPMAVSHAGAKGLCQFMSATWNEEMAKLGMKGGDIFLPSLNIQAAASYMNRMRNVYKAPRPEYDKHSLAMASYNAGVGNIVKAQKLGGGSLSWEPARDALHLVTGHHANETKTYVKRIWNFIENMEKQDGFYYRH